MSPTRITTPEPRPPTAERLDERERARPSGRPGDRAADGHQRHRNGRSDRPQDRARAPFWPNGLASRNAAIVSQRATMPSTVGVTLLRRGPEDRVERGAELPDRVGLAVGALFHARLPGAGAPIIVGTPFCSRGRRRGAASRRSCQSVGACVVAGAAAARCLPGLAPRTLALDRVPLCLDRGHFVRRFA